MILEFLKKYNYSIICGTSNCGKTKYFMNKIIKNKIMLSVVDLKYITPLDVTINEFEKIDIIYYNIRSKLFEFKSNFYCILIDEVKLKN